jgi:hypothetical protein
VRCAWAGNATCAITEVVMNQITMSGKLEGLPQCEFGE